MIRFSEIPFYSKLEDTQKQAIKDLIITVQEKSNLARREGILALEYDLNEHMQKHDFFAEMLSYVVDGVAGEDISLVAINLISSTECSDFEKLFMQVSVNGALGIQEGTNPRLLTGQLLSMLGSEAYFELKNELIKD